MDHSCFSVWPLVFRAGGGEAVIHIHAKYDHARRQLAKVTHARVFPVDGPVDPVAGPVWDLEASASMTRGENGDLTLKTKLPVEDEYKILLQEKTGQGGGYADYRSVAVFHVYAVADDLFALKPFRGDFHMHSFNSDGRESAAYVAASCRKIGNDFMALTDHRNYAPSLEARDRMASYDLDMKCYPGEEVHLPGNPVHIINFGGNASANERAYGNLEAFEAEVAEREKEIRVDTDPLTLHQLAMSEWAYDVIRESGGVAMFCHPYWRPGGHNYVGENLIDIMLERQKFDVLEVFGGFGRGDLESNLLSLMRYQEERAKGRNIPAAGVSDAHTCDGSFFGWYYTVVFAPTNGFADLRKALVSGDCVAVQAVPGSFPIAAGPYRLVKYVYFLLREYFPAHDELCRIEGELVLRHLADSDDADAVRSLAARKGSVPALMKKLWAE